MMLKGMVKSRKVRSKILVENAMITSTIERRKQVNVFNEILPAGQWLNNVVNIILSLLLSGIIDDSLGDLG